MSKEKLKVRTAFRESVFKRDGFRCRKCSKPSEEMDAHHITDRNLMPNGGYVKENGISLCPPCHLLAEEFWSTGKAAEGFDVGTLYLLIGSSHEKAVAASERL